MRSSGLSAGIAALAASTVNAVLIPRQDGVPDNSTNPIAKSFIIEYAPGSAKVRRGGLVSEDIEIVTTFESEIFSGASIVTNSHNLDSLEQLPDVVRVWPNNHVYLEPFDHESFSDDAAAVEYNVHNATGVSKLHDLGYFGEGAKVGVVDTGVWYKHEALGGCFGQDCKVAYGYDLVGDGLWPSEAKSPDDDPLDQQGHGTHVAGIIAGQSGSWTGVAPKATIYAYKVFSRIPGTDEATLIESFLKAFEDGCDVITASIGSTSGWSNNAWAEVASRIAREGVVVTISAGNSGAAGAFFGSSGAAGEEVIAVASVETEVFPAHPFEATFSLDGSDNTTKVGYIPSTYFFPAEIQDWPIVVMNFDTSDPADACEPYPEDTPKLENAIPLVRRGTCQFAVKQANLQALGAKYVLVYNNESPLITPGTEEEGSLIGLITAKAGEAMIKTIQDGGNVTVDFSINPETPVGLEYPAGGLPNAFTSWGGTYDLQIKPDIAAPGGNIFSTYMEGSYAVLSGTSMACPYVAGVAALYIGAHGGRKEHGKDFAKMLSQRIISSGSALPWAGSSSTPNYDFPAPVAQVGNGLIDAFKVVRYRSSLEFEKMALNDTHHFSRYHEVTVKNDGDEDVAYKFSTQPAAGVEIAGWFALPPTAGEFRLKSLSDMSPLELEPSVSLPRDFTLKPGQSKTVSVNFDNPDKLGWNSTALPLFSGKVVVSGSNGEQLSVPYMGLGANLKASMDPIYRTTYPFSRSHVSFVSIADKPWYTFDLSTFSQDFPKIYSKIAWGTREVRWDIFEAGWKERQWKWPLVPGENGYLGPVASWVGAGAINYFDPSRADPDDTFTYPIRDQYRNAQTTSSYHEYWWFGKLGNGSQIEPGNYTMRFATLRPFGNRAHADNWDVFKTPEVEVRGNY